ncbi:MAG: helix-turn-helix domain-containing protein [Actinomycetota bacterium]|nr:helix-turn-helix domain-containing protein [Actinomycetota bacterium]
MSLPRQPVAASKADRRRQLLLDELFGPEVPSSLDGDLLRTGEVARLFQVSQRTVSEWARQGRIPSVQTPGGQRRYPAAALHRLLQGD